MAGNTRQKKLGPAPFASFEDLSEDLSSPESKGYQPMPEICEEHHHHHGDNNDASTSTSTAQTPTTPRIDVEQASSPSQAESGDSTPERELFGLDMAADNLTSAFLEGAADVDLRSSAEDLGIHYSSGSFKGKHSRNSSLLSAGKSAPSGRKISWDAGDQRRHHAADGHSGLERKGSTGRSSANTGDPFYFACRDTRLSSISSNVSATSGMSCLSAFSGRRSPSPHRMQLETSFCGPKASASATAKDDEDDEELMNLEASRRPSLLNPPGWFGDGNSRSTTPFGTPLSPGCVRASMFKYATEPRSRPTSPMGWHSAAPSPMPSLNPSSLGGESSLTSRWLASPRCQRRSSSPHRTLVETSFCGRMQIKVPDDEVEPRGPSPMPSLGSLLSIQSHPVKYATEPRSRPVSPTASRSFFSLTPVPTDSRRGSQTLPAGGRCPSPMIETSFCGPKQMPRRDSFEDTGVSSPAQSTRAPSSLSTRPSETGGTEESFSLRPVRYTTEPRSRPVSPVPDIVQSSSHTSVPLSLTDSPKISRMVRSPSPHRTRVETSFCGPKQLRQESMGGEQQQKQQQQQQPQAQPVVKPAAEHVTVHEVSIHPLPVKYATEPRSRPVSPCSLLSNNCPTPDPERRLNRSPSPHRMIVETSFYSGKPMVPQESVDHAAQCPVNHHQKERSVAEPSGRLSPAPVRYATEPRSRPVSPSVHLLSNHSTPESSRRLRSPSPHRTLVETSFCGAKQVQRQQSEVEPVQQQQQQQQQRVDAAVTPLFGSEKEVDDVSSNSSGSFSELPTSSRNHFDGDATVQSHSSSKMSGAVAVDSEQDKQFQEIDEFATEWPDLPLSEHTATWPAPPQHLTTFELPPEKKSSELRSSSEDTASPPSQHSNGLCLANPASRTVAATSSAQASSPGPVRSGRHMPKPVACPKPPQSFIPQSDSSAQSSPLNSPALSRRMESASPSPSSPFPSRRTSMGGSVRHAGFQATEDATPTEQPDRKTSVTSRSGELSDESPHHTHPEKPDKKEGHKGRSVLSVLFGKRGSKNKNKGKDKDQQEQDLESVDERPAGSHRNGQQLVEPGTSSGHSRMLSLPLPSRDSSPGRSLGDSGQSGDDLDDGEGFRHQVLEAGNESGDNLVESEQGLAPESSDKRAPQPPKEELSLFHQGSIEEELPFVPTTLPIERPIAPLITPVRMRISELKTTAIQRPRCSVSFTPRPIDEYVKIARTDSISGQDTAGTTTEPPKIKVSLPKPEREESVDESAAPVPPIKVTVANVCANWESFAEQVFQRSASRKQAARQESLPAKEEAAVAATVVLPDPTPKEQQQQTEPIQPKLNQWVNVEELPEPVKEAKAIKVVTGNERRQSTPSSQPASAEGTSADGATGAQTAAKALRAAEQDDTPEEEEEGEEEEDDDEEVDAGCGKINLELPIRKDSVSSETALLREIEEAELEEDRSPPLDEDERSLSIRERNSRSRYVSFRWPETFFSSSSLLHLHF